MKLPTHQWSTHVTTMAFGTPAVHLGVQRTVQNPKAVAAHETVCRRDKESHCLQIEEEAMQCETCSTIRVTADLLKKSVCSCWRETSFINSYHPLFRACHSKVRHWFTPRYLKLVLTGVFSVPKIFPALGDFSLLIPKSSTCKKQHMIRYHLWLSPYQGTPVSLGMSNPSLENLPTGCYLLLSNDLLSQRLHALLQRFLNCAPWSLRAQQNTHRDFAGCSLVAPPTSSPGQCHLGSCEFLAVFYCRTSYQRETSWVDIASLLKSCPQVFKTQKPRLTAYDLSEFIQTNYSLNLKLLEIHLHVGKKTWHCRPWQNPQFKFLLLPEVNVTYSNEG